MSRSVEVRRARPLLGTFVEICARGPNDKSVHGGVEAAFAAIGEVQRLMSFHEPTSDLSRINREALRRPVRVHRHTWRVLGAAEAFARETDGVFDITVASSLLRWNYLPRGNARGPAADGTWRDLILERDRQVRFRKQIAIDLGGIAKGFAVDRAVAALQGAGVSAGIVNAGGDLRVFGRRDEKIHVRDPLAPGRAGAIVRLRERALASSASYFARRSHRGRLVSPLVDGQTRRPIVRQVNVTVAAADCMTADALAKVVFALNNDAHAILTRHGADAFIMERNLPPRVIKSPDAPRPH